MRRAKLISNQKIRKACNCVRKETGYRSGFEVAVAEKLKATGTPFDYEVFNLCYTETRVYIPDFVLPNQAIVIEAKGMFDGADRAKMLKVKRAYPNLDIRLVFQNQNVKISKKSKTTYGDWCDKHGFDYAKSEVPSDWLNNKPTAEALAAFKEVCYA